MFVLNCYDDARGRQRAVPVGEPFDAHGEGMRSLTAARLVLLDSDPARREALAKTLAETGVFEIASVATVAEAATVAGGPPDIFLIEGPSLAANDVGGAISPNPFAASGVPTLLMLPEATGEQRRMAVRAGYSAVLGTPVPPRLLYRRIAHLLQKARRTRRRRLALQESRGTPPADQAPAEMVPRVKLTAR